MNAQNTQHVHYPGLDTLRALAILIVIPRHAWELLGGDFVGPTLKSIFFHGWVGVDLFFVLSGFLIAMQLLQAIARDGKVHFGLFYLKRSFRILPSYYIVLLLYYSWPSFREKPDIDPIWRFMLFIMNYGRKGEAFSHAWSLCVEEHFYLVFPWIVAACLIWPRLFRPALLISGVLVGSIALRFHLWSNEAPFFPAVYRPSHTHLDGLTIGVTLALLRERSTQLWSKLTSKPWVLFIIGVVLIGAGMWAYQDLKNPVGYVFTFTFISCGFGAFVVSAMTPGFWLATIRVPGTSLIASLAFTLYLTHKSMIHLAMKVVGAYKDYPLMTTVLSLLFMGAASFLLHKLIEQPFLMLRGRIFAGFANTET